MKRPLHSLQFVAAAASDASTGISVMSSRSPVIIFLSPLSLSLPFYIIYRGRWNQPRRSFSDRPFNAGRGGHYVTGDSHFQSVRETNLGFRQGETEGVTNHASSQPPSFRPRPYRQPYPNQNQQFRPSTPNYQGQHFRRSPPPPFGQNHVQRPPPQYRPRPPPQFRPRPPDYRNWEYAKLARSPSSERFTVLSYNILADYLATDHRCKLYFHIPRYMMDWEWRKKNIFFELGLWSADIMCFQEVDRFQDLEEEFKLRGYSGIWKMRTGNAVDGCAIFWRMLRFKLLHEESIEFDKLGLRGNVAQICVLEMTSQNQAENTEDLHRSSTDSNKVVVCNIHVLYNPKRGDIKLGQVRLLLERAHAVSKIWNDAPIVLCGDFNCTPKSPLYNFILQQKLDLSGLDRDKISGQASAEIRVQRAHNSMPGHADNLIQSPSVVQGREVGTNPSDSSLDTQKPYNSDSSGAIVPSVNKNSQPQSTDSINEFVKSCTKVKDGKDDDAEDKVKEEIQQNAVDDSKNRSGSVFCISGDSFNDDTSRSNVEGGFSLHHLNDDIHTFSATVSSHPEELYSNGADIGCKEKVDSASSLDLGVIGQHFESSDYLEEKSNHDNPMLSLPGGNHSMEAKVDSESLNSMVSETPSSDPSCQACFSDAVGVCSQHSENISIHPAAGDDKGSFSDPSKVNVSPAFSSSEAEEELENLCLNEPDGPTTGGNTVGDDSTFLYASDRSNGVNENLPLCLDSEPSDVGKIIYNPSLWTPMEIETATGKANCTSLEHNLKLRSTYTEVEDGLDTRDLNGEPLVTSYNRCFLGTVDYIWRSEGLQTVRVLAPIPKHVMQMTPGFPTKKWGSDHIALASELAFVKDATDDNTDSH
ncbi:hypothetical protein FNV43_RR12362 [Rhamnella rubrinervis]|uniref:Endonuclease/exonuclease/phosphatase domain-containing protein n=1 Tax=Rhamnella rubrinervis TaxID=2594499 RepID=A0A8K0H776_9ROSA|nr:hypothetical protein FNV43_RR12362 [Rhamnella rubrinervis]